MNINLPSVVLAWFGSTTEWWWQAVVVADCSMGHFVVSTAAIVVCLAAQLEERFSMIRSFDGASLAEGL